jgi:hypothetical protein
MSGCFLNPSGSVFMIMKALGVLRVPPEEETLELNDVRMFPE